LPYIRAGRVGTFKQAGMIILGWVNSRVLHKPQCLRMSNQDLVTSNAPTHVIGSVPDSAVAGEACRGLDMLSWLGLGLGLGLGRGLGRRRRQVEYRVAAPGIAACAVSSNLWLAGSTSQLKCLERP
jgi:hypothetical protein